jgi:hypothetical protein
MKYLKLFENLNFRDECTLTVLVEDNIDQMIEWTIEEKDPTVDIIDCIKHFKGDGFEDFKDGWTDSVNDASINRFCHHIKNALEDEPALYMKHKKFIDDIFEEAGNEIPQHLKRGGKTGLWDLKK